MTTATKNQQTNRQTSQQAKPVKSKQQQSKKSNKKTSRSDIKLVDDNYYSKDTDWFWQSPTWFKKFLNCEAEALAELKGEYIPSFDKKELLVGNYVHSYFESPKAHAEFLKNNPEILAKTGKNKGKPKSDYVIADKAIKSLETDPAFNELYQGDKEVIVTGELFGVKWKGKIDCLNLERGYFIDLKTTAQLDKKFWNKQEHKWESFVAAYNYQLQMWVYQQLIKQTFGVVCQPYIVAVSKEKVPDKAIVSIPDYRMEEAKREIEMRQNHIELVKTGQIKPNFCGICDYCKEHKRLSSIITMDQLIS